MLSSADSICVYIDSFYQDEASSLHTPKSEETISSLWKSSLFCEFVRVILLIWLIRDFRTKKKTNEGALARAAGPINDPAQYREPFCLIGLISDNALTVFTKMNAAQLFLK